MTYRLSALDLASTVNSYTRNCNFFSISINPSKEVISGHINANKEHGRIKKKEVHNIHIHNKDSLN